MFLIYDSLGFLDEFPGDGKKFVSAKNTLVNIIIFMEFLQITSFEDFRVAEIYRSYCETFPLDERRNEKQFRALFRHPKVKVWSLNDAENIGYVVSWELSNFIFVEHFEIFSQFRSVNYGTKVMGELSRKFSHIALEAEPKTQDENAARRMAFYVRNGFQIIDENYVQPSYEAGKNDLPLWLLANWKPENVQYVREEIYDVVYG